MVVQDAWTRWPGAAAMIDVMWIVCGRLDLGEQLLVYEYVFLFV